MRIELAFPCTAEEISEAVGRPTTATGTVIRAITTDSRLVLPGDLFVALRGERTDGHRYLSEAKARGAALLLSEEPFPDALTVKNTRAALGLLASRSLEKQRPTVIAITGSVGKTGTKDAVAAVLSKQYRVYKTSENLNNDLGVAYTVLSRPGDTEQLVLELGTNHPGEIAALSELVSPDIGIITLIGSAHIGAFGSKENILAEKADILVGMHGGPLFLNGDDPYLRTLRYDGGSVLVSTKNAGDFRAEGIYTSRLGTSYTLCTPDEKRRVFLQGTGISRIYSSLFALAVGTHLGVPIASAVEALRTVGYARGRQTVEAVGGIILIDDSYNASPESVAEALRLLSALAPGRGRYAVLGDMLELGDAAEELHREIGRQTAECADFLLAFGDMAGWIREGAIAGGMAPEAISVFPDHQAVIAKLITEISDGDVVLVKASHALGGEWIADRLRTRGRAHKL